MKALLLSVLLVALTSCTYQTDVHSAKTTVVQPSQQCNSINRAVYHSVVYPRYHYVVVDPYRYYYARHYRYCY